MELLSYIVREYQGSVLEFRPEYMLDTCTNGQALVGHVFSLDSVIDERCTLSS